MDGRWGGKGRQEGQEISGERMKISSGQGASLGCARDLGQRVTVGVTLAETPRGGDMDPEGLPVEGGQQRTYKTFDLKCALPARYAGAKMEHRWREWPANDWPKLRTIPWARTSL